MREEPGVRENESEQRAAAREEPGVREHESEQRAKILIWFVQRWRMHLLLTKEALTIVVLLACLT